jgi:hypothetical protein
MTEFKAVLRVERIKNLGNLSGRVKHNNRGNFKQDIENIDKKRTGLNFSLFSENTDIKKMVDAAIEKYGLSQKNGSLCAEMILTAGKEYFDNNYPNWKTKAEILNNWIEKNKQFLTDKYGSENVSAVIHLDEETPHIHAFIIPLSETRYKNRFKETTKLKINYSAIFGDTFSDIKKARNTGTTDDLKLGKLQTDYAEYLQDLGLKRGTRKSEAKHITTQQFKSMINNQIQTADIKLNKEFTTISNVKDRINIWLKGNDSKIMKSHKQAMSENYQKANKINEQNKALKIDLSLKENQINNLENTLKSYEKRETNLMNENKEYVQSLRDLSIDDVCDKLEISEDLKKNIIATKFNNKKFNCIDFVIKAYDLDYKSAVSLLSEKYPQEQVLSAINNKEFLNIQDKNKSLVIEVNKPEIKERKALTRGEIVKQEIINKQLSVLGADNYRITLMHESKPSFNLGKNREQDGSEKLYTKDEIIDKYIPYLSALNAEGYNVFLTPFCAKVDYILLDDVKMDKLDPFKSEFCIIQKSSENSTQAIAKIEKGLSKEVLNAGFKALNEKYGDPNISAQLHPFRLAGFTNRKLKHKDEKGNYPFVRIIQAIEMVSEKVKDFVKINGSKIISQNILQKWENEKNIIYSKIELRNYYKNIKAGADLSSIDFKIALKAKENGLNPEQIKNVLKEISPKLSERHPNIDKYLDLTVKNVFSNYTKTPQPTVKKGIHR